MRRAAAFVIGTATGTALLVGAKLGTAPAGGTTATGDDAGTTVVVAGPGPHGTPKQAGSPHPRGTAAPTGTATGTPTPGRTGHATPTRPATPTPTGTKKPTPTPTPTPTGPADGTYSASAPVAHNRGTLSMTVTVSGHRITAISASETNPTESNCYHSACNTLRSEALSAQNANIATYSGATYTSDAFRAALQAILNTASG